MSAMGGLKYRQGHFAPSGILLRFAGAVGLSDAQELVGRCSRVVTLRKD